MQDEPKLPKAVFAPEMGVVVVSIKEYEELKEVEWMYKDLRDEAEDNAHPEGE